MGRRQKNDGAFSLFAFQDIITGVTGIMVFVLLIFSLSLSQDAASQTPVSDESAVVSNPEFDDVVKELTQARKQLINLKDQLGEYQQFDRERVADQMKKQEDESRVLDIQIQEMLKELAVHKVGSSKVKLKQDKFLELTEQKKTTLKMLNDESIYNRIAFIPDRQSEGKRPIFVELSKQWIKFREPSARKFLHKYPNDKTGVDQLSSFAKQSCDVRTEYFVFLLKPSAASQSKYLVYHTLKGIGFDVGLEPMEEEMQGVY